MESHDSTQGALTAQEVQDAVIRVKAEQSLDTIREHLRADHVFSGVQKRYYIQLTTVEDKEKCKSIIREIQLPLQLQATDK